MPHPLAAASRTADGVKRYGWLSPGAAFTSLLVAIPAERSLGLARWQALAGAALIVALTSVPASTVTALGLAAMGWAFYDGFAVHRDGDLSFGWGQVVPVLLLGMAAVCGAHVGQQPEHSP